MSCFIVRTKSPAVTSSSSKMSNKDVPCDQSNAVAINPASGARCGRSPARISLLVIRLLMSSISAQRFFNSDVGKCGLDVSSRRRSSNTNTEARLASSCEVKPEKIPADRHSAINRSDSWKMRPSITPLGVRDQSLTYPHSSSRLVKSSNFLLTDCAEFDTRFSS